MTDGIFTCGCPRYVQVNKSSSVLAFAVVEPFPFDLDVCYSSALHVSRDLLPSSLMIRPNRV